MEQERVEVIVTVRVPDRIVRKDFMPYIVTALGKHDFNPSEPEPLSFIYSRFTGPDWYVTARGTIPRAWLEALRSEAAFLVLAASDGKPDFGKEDVLSGVVLDRSEEGGLMPLWQINALMLLHTCCKPFVDISDLLPRPLRAYLRY